MKEQFDCYNHRIFIYVIDTTIFLDDKKYFMPFTDTMGGTQIKR